MDPSYRIVLNMNALPTVITDNLRKPQSAYAIYKRLANLLLAVIVAAICINLWMAHKQSSQDWYNNQTQQLGRSLVQQAALALVKPVRADDNQAMQQLLANLTLDPHVSAAALFDFRGRLIDSTSSEVSVAASFRLDDLPPLVFLNEILDDGQVIGYVRIFLSRDNVMRFHADYQRQWTEQMQVLALLAALAGAILMRAFYKLRERVKQRLQSESE